LQDFKSFSSRRPDVTNFIKPDLTKDYVVVSLRRRRSCCGGGGGGNFPLHGTGGRLDLGYLPPVPLLSGRAT